MRRSTVPELERVLVPELERARHGSDGARPVVIDLSECTFIDSTALGALVAANRRLDGKTQLSLVVTSAEIERPFELAGLDREFAFHPSLDSAVEWCLAMSSLHAREARSQALFREVNERIKQLGRRFRPSR